MKQLMFDILTGQKRLASAWNPGLEQGAIMVGGCGWYYWVCW
jgi:hypothetical protein